MSFRVEFTGPAAAQVDAAHTWWLANRPAAPELLGDELADALELLTAMPLKTQVWGDVDGTPVYKLRLPRTRYALYYTLLGDLVTVRALWHGARGTDPLIG
ncbi:MAG: type II toxin-antitoxin system RelE/ParE family toxin [Polyangiaceae bacterium]|nr:type II toxin-antitoxin system RelE/ParE family toxin [Polyangiaceae bacterium]MCW5790553.1 type II toxin-antitoxin system RelE/ParE family toxin [Polyangiaceae bacterium]